MQLYLRVQIGSPRCSVEGKYPAPLSIGRQEGATLFVIRDDRRVSGLHCILRVEQGRIVVENRSQNGTLVGDFPVMTVGGCQILQPGQTLQVGETLLDVSLARTDGPTISLQPPRDAEHTLSALSIRKFQSQGLESGPRPGLGDISAAPPINALLNPGWDARDKLTLESPGRSGARVKSPPGPGMPAFVITEEVPGALGQRWGGDLRLVSPTITFGRMADVLLDDLMISRQHFRLHRTSTGADVENAGSLHGVQLNGRRVVQRQPLRDRDVLQAGLFTLSLNFVGQDILVRVRGLEHETTQEATLSALATGVGRVDRAGAYPGGSSPYSGQGMPPGSPGAGAPPAVGGGHSMGMGMGEGAANPLSQPEGTLVVLPSQAEPKEGGRKRTAARWVPTSDLRYDSWLKGLVGTTGLGLLLFFLLGMGARGSALLSPGPLSEVHQSMTGGDCASCHLPGKADVSLGCLQSRCHANAAQPLPPEAQDGLPVSLTGIHLSVGEAAAIHPELPLACNSCHVEHRPTELALRSPPAGRCLECHASAHVDDTRFAALEPFERSELRCTACHVQHPKDQAPTLQEVPITSALLTAPPELENPPSSLPAVLTVWGGLSLAFCPPVGYGLWMWRKRKRLAEKVAAAARAAERENLPGPPKPQIPHVDPLKCVGCRACVDACPFDALDIVDGIAKLVSRPACHGVAICAEVCPTGAISMAATAVSPHQAPINDEFESVLNPGIFLVGDLSGLSLIKNAINTGVLAAETIARRPRRDDCEVDIAIVGSGPSGLSTGLRSAELGLRYVLLEQGSVANTLRHFPRSKLVFAQPFDVPLLGKVPMAECTKEQLLAMWDALIVRYGLKIHENEKVLTIERRLQGGFVVTTTQRSYTAAQVVLAIGKRGTPRRLGAKGEDAEKVLYNLVDAEHYKGKKVFVYGAGDVALETALALAGQKGTEVTLGYRGEKIDMAKKRNVDKLNAAAASGKMRVRPGVEKVLEIRPQEVVIQTIEGPVELSNDVVFACIGADMPTAWLKSIGVMA